MREHLPTPDEVQIAPACVNESWHLTLGPLDADPADLTLEEDGDEDDDGPLDQP